MAERGPINLVQDSGKIIKSETSTARAFFPVAGISTLFVLVVTYPMWSDGVTDAATQLWHKLTDPDNHAFPHDGDYGEMHVDMEEGGGDEDHCPLYGEHNYTETTRTGKSATVTLYQCPCGYWQEFHDKL